MERPLWAEPRGAYAILLLLVLAVLGAALAPGGLRDRSRNGKRIFAGAVLVGAALSLLWPQLRARPALSADPAVPSAATVIGAWVDGADTLAIADGGTYQCRGERCLGVGTRGTWTLAREGDLVMRWSDGHEVPWRVVTFHGRHRLALLPLPPGEQGWVGRLVFQRVGE